MYQIMPKVKSGYMQISNIFNIKNNQNSTTTEIHQRISHFTNLTLTHDNNHRTLETTIRCVGPLYNQSCLFRNLYYTDTSFMILTIKGRYLPPYSVRTDAFRQQPLTLYKREFDSYFDLEIFVRTIADPKIIPSVTVYFGQPWHYNIGHALFDGLYPAYVALIRFSPRHLNPFRILTELNECDDCWTEDVYSRFGGLGILKQTALNKMSKGRWFVFDEIIMGSGVLCQRCTQPNLQLPGGVELDASRLFRDRMYHQHGVFHPIVRQRSSSEYRTSRDILRAYIIDNKRFKRNDRKQIHDAINELNNYTNSYLNKTLDKSTQLEWPLIHVSYLYYGQVKADNLSHIQINTTQVDSRVPTYELIDNNFIAQLKLLREMDIHICGPGTGQMYQTFLSDGSVTINLGGIRPWGSENTEKAFHSYLEQYLTSGTPYIKGLYYPINERVKGIQKDEVVKLIRQAGQLILQGFSLPVNPRENLAVDGQLFVEMCEKDKEFCSLVTTRLPDRSYACVNIWVEDFVHEYLQWQVGGFIYQGENITCPYNHSLLHELRDKYGIKHNVVHSSKSL